MEIPAGMIDEESFSGAAAKEIQEETGLVIPKHELLDLAELALGKQVRAEERTPPPIPSHSPFPIPHSPYQTHFSHLISESAMYPSPDSSDECIAIFLWEKVLDRQEIVDLKGKLTG
jgi:8-oxo-dGTP pyrophosphatase MutT (NUDIX family)